MNDLLESALDKANRITKGEYSLVISDVPVQGEKFHTLSEALRKSGVTIKHDSSCNKWVDAGTFFLVGLTKTS